MPPTRNPGLLGHYAGFASRFVALLIDGLLVSLSIGAITLTTFTVQSLLRLAVLFDFVNEWGLLSDLINSIAQPDPAFLTAVSALFLIGYHIFFLSTAGRTPGKALMGLRVLTTGGGRLSLLRSTLRLSGYIFSALPLFAGFVLVLIDDRRQSLHDKLAGTYVVYAWAARPDETFLESELKRLTPKRRKKTAPRKE